MTKFLIGLLLICVSTKDLNAQKVFEVSIPETYELSNIILALTDYGKADEWEVQKHTRFYEEVIKYFEPVKSHPLLKQVNYSRALWEDYLSFRTDAAAYKFDDKGKLTRTNNFYANKGHNPFDANLDLINDFVQKSNYRNFYKAHVRLYNDIAANYSGYYMLDTMKMFLEKERSVITITQKDIIKWDSDSSIVLQLKVPHDEFALILNWWGCRYPVLSNRDIMLAPQSYILLKKS